MTGQDRVRAQYETYPYPARDPADERKRLITGSPSHLAEINHYLFAGALDLEKPFRVLIAGGGTGDAAIMLGQQLKDAGAANAEILYLDLSTASRDIAEARAKERGLDNIRFETGSLLDLDKFGAFDYIDCCGVLHHLPTPQDGFQSLASALTPQGGIGMMVYGSLGRSGVYETQAMLRAITDPDDPPSAKVEKAKALLQALPPTNPLRRNAQITDQFASDAGLYDLLLHSIDRAYLVEELGAELEGAGLRAVTFIEPLRYDPSFYTKDKTVLAGLKDASDITRAAFAERMAGNLRKHILYCVPKSRSADTIAKPTGPHMVPVFRDPEALLPGLSKMPAGASFTVTFDGLDVRQPLSPMAKEILTRCDGKRSLDQIRKEMPGSLDWFRFKPQFDAVYGFFNGINALLLRNGKPKA